MINANAMAVADRPHLSLKAACVGFFASTVALTLLMVAAGNLI